MKVLVLLFLAGASSAFHTAPIYSMEQAEEYFEEFIQTYDKNYKSQVEKTKRMEIFKQNLELINQKNLQIDGAVYGITKFTDLTNREFIEIYTGLKGAIPAEAQCKPGPGNFSTAPDSWNWKDKGIISKAKDQGRCGSCWAFSAIGNVEAQYAKKHKDLLDLSEQQVVDCDNRSSGCRGTRDLQYPFMYLIEATGAMQEQDYPYEMKQQKCRFDKSKVKVKVNQCLTYNPTTEDELKNMLYSAGPLSIGVDASDMQHYHKGILKNCSFTGLNHAVLLVGYGSENNTPFWVIKNSWSELYGEDGFIRIKRGVNACGIMADIKLNSVVS